MEKFVEKNEENEVKAYIGYWPFYKGFSLPSNYEEKVMYRVKNASGKVILINGNEVTRFNLKLQDLVDEKKIFTYNCRKDEVEFFYRRPISSDNKVIAVIKQTVLDKTKEDGSKRTKVVVGLLLGKEEIKTVESIDSKGNKHFAIEPEEVKVFKYNVINREGKTITIYNAISDIEMKQAYIMKTDNDFKVIPF